MMKPNGLTDSEMLVRSASVVSVKSEGWCLHRNIFLLHAGTYTLDPKQ